MRVYSAARGLVSSGSNVGLRDLALHDYAGAGTGLLAPVKRNHNATTYKDIVYNCAVPSLWLSFEEEPHTVQWLGVHNNEAVQRAAVH